MRYILGILTRKVHFHLKLSLPLSTLSLFTQNLFDKGSFNHYRYLFWLDRTSPNAEQYSGQLSMPWWHWFSPTSLACMPSSSAKLSSATIYPHHLNAQPPLSYSGTVANTTIERRFWSLKKRQNPTENHSSWIKAHSDQSLETARESSKSCGFRRNKSLIFSPPLLTTIFTTASYCLVHAKVRTLLQLVDPQRIIPKIVSG